MGYGYGIILPYASLSEAMLYCISKIMLPFKKEWAETNSR